MNRLWQASSSIRYDLGGHIQTSGVGVVGGKVEIGTINFSGGDQQSIAYKTRCMKALFVCEMKDVHSKVMTLSRSAFVPEVCRWILDTAEYQQWSDENSGSQLLWISGQSGAGKTMHALYISKHLEAQHRSCARNCVVYHFCNFTSPEHKRPISIVRSIMYNMIEQYEDLYGELEVDFKKQEENLFIGSSIDSLSALWRVWLKMVGKMKGQTIWIILDGFDVLAEEDQNLLFLLRKFTMFYRDIQGSESAQAHVDREDAAGDLSPSARLPTETFSPRASLERRDTVRQNQRGSRKQRKSEACKIKFLILSQNSPPTWLEEELNGFPRLKLDRQTHMDYAQSFQTYFAKQYANLPHMQRQTPEDKAAILRVFEQRQDSSFVPVNHVIEKLKATRVEEATKVIQEIPTGLEENYVHALTTIPANLMYDCAAIIRWTAVAHRPMTVAELSMGLGFAFGSAYQQRYSVVNINQLLEFCKPLLTIHEDCIAFIHQSALDFMLSTAWHQFANQHLQSFMFDSKTAHTEIARASLQCLTCPDVLTKPIAVGRANYAAQHHLKKWPFLAYAICFWPQHARAGQMPANEYYIPFFAKASKLRDTWWASHHMSHATRVSWEWLVPKDFSLLHMACFFDLHGLAEHVERSGWLLTYLNKHDSHKKLPLDYALTNNSLSTMAFMLQRNAWLADQRYEDYSLLHNAAQRGNLNIINIILANRQVNIDMSGSIMTLDKFSTWFAVLRTIPGTTDGALNERKDDGSLLPFFAREEFHAYGKNVRPVHLAAQLGHEHVTRFLLERGANTVMPSSFGHTPLHFATIFGQLHIVKILLQEYGAWSTLNAVTKDGWTPLHFAARSGNWECTEFLIESGAQIHALTAKWKNALHLAVYRRNLDACVVLMNHGIHLEAYDHKSRTPLMQAQELGWEEGVQYLINYGCNPQAVDAKGLSIYTRAVNKKQYQIAKILQEGPKPFPELAEQSTGATSSEKITTDLTGSSERKESVGQVAPPPYSEYFELRNLDNKEKITGNCDDNPTPSTSFTLDDIDTDYYEQTRPACVEFLRALPDDPRARQKKYIQLTESISVILLRLDDLRLSQDEIQRERRKEIVTECQRMLTKLDRSSQMRPNNRPVMQNGYDDDAGATIGSQCEDASRPQRHRTERSESQPILTLTTSQPAVAIATADHDADIHRAQTAPPLPPRPRSGVGNATNTQENSSINQSVPAFGQIPPLKTPNYQAVSDDPRFVAVSNIATPRTIPVPDLSTLDLNGNLSAQNASPYLANSQGSASHSTPRIPSPVSSSSTLVASSRPQQGMHGIALYKASENGHTETVRLLITKGADVNAIGGPYGTALQAASINGHADIAKLLLDNGADIDAQGGTYGSALDLAAAGGHTGIVDMLLV